MITLLVFLLFLIFFLFIPGYVLSRKLTQNLLFKVFTSLLISSSLLVITSLLEGYFKIPFLVIICFIVLNIIFFLTKAYKDFYLIQIKLTNLDYLNIGLILIGIIFQCLTVVKSGKLGPLGVGYWGPLARDGVWHEAVIGQLMKSIPPFNPGFAGFELTNYHYFFDLLIAKSSLITHIQPQTLLYRFFPVLFSLLLGIGTYLLSNKLFTKKQISFFAIFFAYFGSSFGWVVEYLRSKTFGGESAFWANQPVSMNLNPPYAISLLFLIALVLLLLELKNNYKNVFIPMVIIGSTLIGFKVYAGIIFLAAFFLISFWEIIKFRNYNHLKIFLITFLFSLVCFRLVVSGDVSLIELHPFWFIDSMIDLTDRVGWLKLSSARYTYLAEENWLKYSLAEILSFVIFVFGNLGTRIIGIIIAVKLFFKSFHEENKYLVIFTVCLIAFIPPILFVQKGNPWNVIQFLYYFIYFFGFFAAYVLYKIFESKKIVSILLLLVIMILTPISSWSTFKSGFYPNPPAYLSNNEFEALIFLEKQDDGSVLTYPFNKDISSKFKDPYPLFAYAPSAYVSAYTKKQTYVEDVEQQLILNVDYLDRVKNSENFFKEKNVSLSNEFLKTQSIKYLYLPKTFYLPMAEEEYQMIKIFENQDVKIYKII